MRLKTVSGILRFKNVTSRVIDWEGKCKSKFQAEVRKLLYPKWKHHVVYEEFPVYGTMLTLDFYNATKKIAIEVQGGQHTSFNKYFHKSRFDYLAQLKKDEQKRTFCDLNEIKLVEIFYEEKKELSREFIDNLDL